VQEFVKAMNARFAMLDIVKSQKASKGKDAKEELKITNKLKIITTPDSVFNLWSEVISSNAHRELIDPETLLPFNKNVGWKLESRNLTHEFFKWLENLSYDDMAKLAKHILQINTRERVQDYPKVTIK